MKCSPANLNKIDGTVVLYPIKDALDNLEELKDISFIFDEDRCDKFYSTIFELTKKSFSTNQDLLNGESLQAAKWAIELWDDAANAEKLDRMFVGYLILDYLAYPVDTLPIIWDSQKRKELSLKATAGFSFDIGVPEDADYPHQSQFKQYRDGIENKDLGKLLAFFSSLEMGIGIAGRNPAPPKLIQLISKIHKNGILSLLSKDQPALAELTLQSFNADVIAELLADNYTAEHEFPLVRGFIIVATYYNEQLKQGKEDGIPYEKMAIILEKLQVLPTWNTTFKLLANAATLKWNPIFHYCCGLRAAKSIDIIDHYVETIEFSLEEYNYGNSFYKAIILSNNDDAVLHASNTIFTKYREYLKSYKGQYAINRATSYFNFIAMYVHHKSKDVAGYQVLLDEQLDRVNSEIDSWFPHRSYFELQILHLFIATNFTLGFAVDADVQIVKKIKSFILDERHQGILSGVGADTLIALLTNPNEVDTLTLVYDNGKPAELRRNRTDDMQNLA